MTTHPPTPPATHHCLHCGQPLRREGEDWPWKDPAGRWRCPKHPRRGETRIIPHLAVPTP